MMFRVFTAAAAALLLALAMPATPAEAGGRSFLWWGESGAHPQSDYYRGKPQVRGFRKRVGGYSYSGTDVQLNKRDLITVPEAVRGPQGNPFDSGFFFDSNVTAYGSTAPYMN